MMARSTAGCYNCKRRKKKCDEAQPHCVRCIQSGKQCEGYAPLESPDSKGVMRRARTARGQVAQIMSVPRSNTPDSQEEPSNSSSSASPKVSDQRHSANPLASPLDSGPRLSQQPSLEHLGAFPLLKATPHLNTIITSSIPLVNNPSAGLPGPGLRATGGVILTSSSSSGSTLIKRSFQSLGPSGVLFEGFEGPNLFEDTQFLTLGFLSHELLSPDIEDDDLEDDPEGIKQEMCVELTLDPNTLNNALPFVLQCYIRWMNLVVFEPSKAIRPIKETIISQFMGSSAERSKIILLSNVIGSLGKTIELDPRGMSLVTYLRAEAHQDINKFISDQPANEHELDMQNALKALSLMMEVILIQRYSSSLLSVVKLMEAAAPVFRRACPEPTNQYVNLPRAIMSPAINIKHFATTDVIISIATGRPMLFRYDVNYPPGILEQIKVTGSGMQWLHGIADQYIVILARINVLFEEFGANVSAKCITEIENQIREVDTSTERSADPVLTIWRFTVRKCWVEAMYIYLYMVLCRVRADDSRVVKLVKSYIRLMEAVTPGRNPDAFLYIPMIIVGASAYQKQGRAAIYRRMLGLQECIKPGTCGYEAVKMLTDLWRRTEAENRPAVWDDLRLSAFRVSGV
ncbi:unnamed protein product [Rhizoctonia solani]|uniref:Zn(2)-C6 fungal-type domain-containing protein n=1 Tax=Rhizoctonia solani TaxID=456999 RepID=A0A8H3HH32_9AGAM|nr:unnamed protein product [Rhizoctonia solani]